MTPATEERLTIEPPPVAFIARTASRQPKKVPSTLTAWTLRQSASVSVSILPFVPTPALLTRMSSRPNVSTTASTTSRQRASSVTSCMRVRSASGPRAARPCSLRSVAATFAPSARNSAAVARPMPDAAPVMSATLPASRPALFGIGPSLKHLLSLRHAKGAVDADRLAVDVAVLDDMDRERRIFGGLAEAWGERHGLAERFLGRLRQAEQHRGHEDARRDRIDADSHLGELAGDRQRHRHHSALGGRIGRLADLALIGR